jgi:hypothetical protein
MAKIENRTYSKEAVNLDGNEFVNCTFNDCTLVYRGGPLPRFAGNSIERCVWNFSDAAELTLRFIAGLYQAGEGGKDVVEKIFDQIRQANFKQTEMPIPPAGQSPA